jgi:hypothetical protein
MRLREAAGGEGPAAGFLDLAPAIHRDDRRWIPEDRERLAACFGAGSPWLARGRAHTFCVPGRARASVYRPAGLEIDGAPAAFFGHFESAGDRAAEALVLDAARAWARGEGAARLYGPVDLSPALGHCLRLDGGARSRRYLDEPYNPARYAVALGALGLREHRRYAGLACATAALAKLVAAGDGAVRTLLAAGYAFEALTPAVWEQRREEVRELANVVFAGNFGFTPLSRAEFAATFDARWTGRLDPDLSVVAVAPDGRVAGFSPYIPDYVPLLAQGAGAARVGLDDLEYERHAGALARLGKPAAVARAGGVAPAHQRLGVAGAMTSWVARRALEKGVRLFYTRIFVGNRVLRLFKDVRTARRSYALLAADL